MTQKFKNIEKLRPCNCGKIKKRKKEKKHRTYFSGNSILSAKVTTCLCPAALPGCKGCSGILRGKKGAKILALNPPSACCSSCEHRGAGRAPPAPPSCSSGENSNIPVILKARASLLSSGCLSPPAQGTGASEAAKLPSPATKMLQTERGSAPAIERAQQQLLSIPGFKMPARQHWEPAKSLTSVKNLPLVPRCHLPVEG